MDWVIFLSMLSASILGRLITDSEIELKYRFFICIAIIISLCVFIIYKLL